MALLWTVAMLMVVLYCIVQTVRDFRRRAYPIAVIGLLCVIALAAIPIPGCEMSVTLPIANPS